MDEDILRGGGGGVIFKLQGCLLFIAMQIEDEASCTFHVIKNSFSVHFFNIHYHGGLRI